MSVVVPSKKNHRKEMVVISSGKCQRPIRLFRVDSVTGDIAEVLVPCKSRHRSHCFYCSQKYSNQVRSIILSGAERKQDKLSFLTLTCGGSGRYTYEAFRQQEAYDFEAEYLSLVGQEPDKSRFPKLTDRIKCKHHVAYPSKCLCKAKTHKQGNSLIGQPIWSSDDFDYRYAVVYNHIQPKLWDSFMHALRRAIKARGGDLDFAYFRVVEWQARGLIHHHILFRGDVIQSDVNIALAAARYTVGLETFTFGANYKYEDIDSFNKESVGKVKRYLVKYLTKSLIGESSLNPHLQRLRNEAECVARQMYQADFKSCPSYDNAFHYSEQCYYCRPIHQKVRRFARSFGYTGHVLSKSTSRVSENRSWGLSFSQLREAAKRYNSERKIPTEFAEVLGHAIHNLDESSANAIAWGGSYDYMYLGTGYDLENLWERDYFKNVLRWQIKEQTEISIRERALSEGYARLAALNSS